MNICHEFPPQSELLAVCLPTRNRPEALKKSLGALIAKVCSAGIPIFVSDNGDQSVLPLVESFQSIYPYVYYIKPACLLNTDLHFEWVLNFPKTKYRWLFGDHYLIEPEFSINTLLEILGKGHAVIGLNSRGRIHGIESGEIADCGYILREMAWHLTMLTALIYEKSFLTGLQFYRYNETNFAQTLSILDGISNERNSFYWCSDHVITSFSINSSSTWHSRAISIFVRDWFHGIMSLPTKYELDWKYKAIRSHAINVDLFSWKGMFYLRSIGAISLSKVFSVRKEIFFAFNFSQVLFLFLVLLFPIRFVSSMFFLRRTIRARFFEKNN